MQSKSNTFFSRSASESTGLLLWQTHNYWQREIKKILKPFELTHTQFVILANTQWLSLQQKKVTQVNIAKQAQTDIMMTSNVIRTLEKKGFLLRKNHPTDTRAKLVFITDSGLKILTKTVKVVEEFDTSFFAKLQDMRSFNTELSNLLV